MRRWLIDKLLNTHRIRKEVFFGIGFNGYSMRFIIDAEDLDEIKTLLRMVGSYNKFNAEEVIKAVEDVFGEVSGFEVGRAFSPVLFIHLPMWNDQQNKNRGIPQKKKRPLTKREIDEIRTKVLDRFKRCEPDELWTSGYKDVIVRAWWD